MVPVAVAQTAPAEAPDVVVEALHRLRLSVSLHGRVLGDCAVRVSSGDPQIDRVACEATRTCVANGRSEGGPLTDCVNDTIAAYVRRRTDDGAEDR